MTPEASGARQLSPPMDTAIELVRIVAGRTTGGGHLLGGMRFRFGAEMTIAAVEDAMGRLLVLGAADRQGTRVAQYQSPCARHLVAAETVASCHWRRLRRAEGGRNPYAAHQESQESQPTTRRELTCCIHCFPHVW